MRWFAGGVRWFHTGGVMAALSEGSTEVVRAGMEAARRRGAVVSYDCNYRASLWQGAWGGGPGSVAVNRGLMPLVDVLFGHEGDVAAVASSHGAGLAYGRRAMGRWRSGFCGEFPGVKVIASTVRQPEDGHAGMGGGLLLTRKAKCMRGWGLRSWRFWIGWVGGTRSLRG